MTNNIRIADEKEISDIMKIWVSENISAHNFIEKKYWENNTQKTTDLIKKSKTFIYEKNGEIIGFISLSGNYINNICIKKEHQRNGIGKKLLVHCKNIFWSLIVRVYFENNQAVSFFEKNSFFERDKINNAETEKCELCMEWIK